MKRITSTTLALALALLLVIPAFSPAAAAPPAPTERADVNAPAVPGQFLIKFKPGTTRSTRTAVVQAEGGQFYDWLADLDIDAVEFPAFRGNANPNATTQLLNRLKRNPNVEFVDPNYIFTISYVPNEPALSSNQYAWNTIQAYSAWDTTHGAAGTVIAIVDTGIQRSHPDLDGKIVAGYDYVQGDAAPDDGNGHGTHVAGSAAAETNNNTGGAGTCPNCKLMPVRVLDDNGSGTLDNVAKGITYAANNGAKVINLSLGGPGSSTFRAQLTTLQIRVSFWPARPATATRAARAAPTPRLTATASR